MSTLVIVESPTKAKTIRNYLPKNYKVIASMGHIRDLPQSAKDIPEKIKDQPWSKLGVNVADDFAPLYLIPKSKIKIVQELKKQIKTADQLLLATDEDREGESISWHLMEVLKPKVPTKRMVFHEITPEAIEEALKQCREIDDKLVRAQETRRILDRLVGYTLSPLIWKKIAFGLSAGRVQSAAVSTVVRRERERRSFKKAAYWDISANLEFDKISFESKLSSVSGKRLATSKDFDEHTGKILENKDIVLLGEKEVQDLKQKALDSTWQVKSLEERSATRKPAPPFITSTLQQEANRKLGMSARNTMRLAQSLYEKGLITYMRTDSTHLSAQAITATRKCVKEMYGNKYLSEEVRTYKSSNKRAQDAHEAIRPAGSAFKTPKESGLTGKDLALYELIWKRTVATQMTDAELTYLTAEIEVANMVFKSSGKRIDFPGFFRAYVEGTDDPFSALESQESLFPPFKTGDALNLIKSECQAHETMPPARYTEASLIKKLEAEGVGRPSTYATIISTIIDRGYVTMNNNALIPTFTAFAVTSLLEQHFPHLVDLGFTANMEDTLDNIATGEVEWLPYLKDFYSGDNGLAKQVMQRESQINPEEARTISFDDLDGLIKIGRYGAYLELNKGGEICKATIPNNIAPADLDNESIDRIFKLKEEGPQILGRHPENDKPIFVLDGKYGPYVQWGDVTDEKIKPKRVSLPPGKKPEDIDMQAALGLLSLPRTVGLHPESGKKIHSNIGRFGPFICHDLGKEGKDYRSLRPKEGDDPVTITLERALELFAIPKKSRGRGRAKALIELGNHPETDNAVSIFNGPYGYYVKHGKTNVAIPEGMIYDKLTLEEAIGLIRSKSEKKSPSKKKKASQE
ncbi:MAG: type I DNA topoisomerase [Deltaproteobacteria bacterium]|nr:type I DNA topoisomerase [Deltaproteobacteria bacterium]